MTTPAEQAEGYLPIAEHGLVGDLHTVALVGTNGTIDWYCCPHFDSPSVFGSILDKDKGGYYAIHPVGDAWQSKQLYFPDTNVLITRFYTYEGVGEVQDFMPIEGQVHEGVHRHRLIRRVIMVRGHMRFEIEVQPRFDYARAEHEVEMHPHGVLFRSPDLTLALEGAISRAMGSARRLERVEGGVRATFELDAGSAQTFVLERVPADHICRPFSERETLAAFEATVGYWRNWLAHSSYRGRWREMVNRSALTLKLLTFAPTGAIVASPTCSLPEQLGGERNWDYRYTWIRDAAFSLYGLLRLGFPEEASAFMAWLDDRVRERRDRPGGPLQIMYGIDGRSELPEEELTHLSGYRDSAPVRIGNGAADQRQLDIYGELIDSVYLFNKYGRPIFNETWAHVRRIVDWLCEHWDQVDEGIWETRGGQKDFTYSRLMSWVAIERAIRMNRARGLPGDIVRWLAERSGGGEQVRGRRVGAGDGDLDRPAHRRFGHRQPVPGRAWDLREQRHGRRQRRLRGVGVALRAPGGGQVRGQLQRFGDRGRPRGRGAIERIGGPDQQLLGVVGDVVPAAGLLRIGEVVQRDVEQVTGRGQPAVLPRHLVQRQQPGGQRRVVVEDRGGCADHTAQAGPPQPAVADVQVQQSRRALRCGGDHVGVAERDARVAQRGDREPVPRGDDLVVATRLRTRRPGRAQHRADALVAHDVLGVGPQLQHRRAVLERADPGDTENRSGPTTVVVAERRAQLGRGPHVRQPLVARGIGVQRRDEHAVAAQLVEQESGRLLSHPARQRIRRHPRPVRVEPQQLGVVVEHLLEMRDHPGGVHAVTGEAAGQLIVETAPRHRLARAHHRRQRRRRTRALVVP